MEFFLFDQRQLDISVVIKTSCYLPLKKPLISERLW